MSEPSSMTEKEPIPLTFHFFRIKFTPYVHAKGQTTESIVREVVNYLMQEKTAGRGLLIDKHETRAKNTARPLFVTNVAYFLKEKRIHGSIALLRTGKIPMLKPAETYSLIPFDTSIGQIAEQTHFFIDYSSDSVVICVEYNYHGPRALDIEYYFRVVARDKLNLSKATDLEVFMDTSLDKTLAELRNVLNFEVKLHPQKLHNIDAVLQGQYLSGVVTLANLAKPKFIKLEAMFQTPGKQYTSSELNKGGNKMVMDFLKAFKTKPINMDAFEEFIVKFEDKDGNQEVFNLLSGKKELVKYVTVIPTKGRDWYELIKDDLTEFIQSLQS